MFRGAPLSAPDPEAGPPDAADGTEVRCAYRLSGKCGKNDAADAAAIREALQRPHMRFVRVKSEQARLGMHTVRQGPGAFAHRHALKRIRALMSEFGMVLPLKAQTVRRRAGKALDARPNASRSVRRQRQHHQRLLDARARAPQAGLQKPPGHVFHRPQRPRP